MNATIKRVALLFLLGISAISIASLTGILIQHQLKQELPQHYSFASGLENDWTAYDGTWTTMKNVVKNDSDERGAKLVSGSRSWKNYVVNTDIELLGNTGDAGVIVRLTDEERGVDSYSGYYVGLRATDGTLIIGRANHDWTEFQSKRVKSGLQPFHWYHLEVIAIGDTIAAELTDPVTHETETVSMRESATRYAERGRIGLRSVAVGGAWKNISVAAATEKELSSLLGGKAVSTSIPLTLEETLAEYGGNTTVTSRPPTVINETTQAEPISDLRVASIVHKSTVMVRGEVILTQPHLYIQDSTGGASVEAMDTPPLKIGDDVEVQGEVEPHEFSSRIHNATVRVLWPETPNPPLSITAFQAATGAFAGRFVELQGIFDFKSESAGRLILDLHEGDQRFQVVLEPYNPRSHLRGFKPSSLLLVRGVCVTDTVYTNSLVPFGILLRSADDIQVIGSPPWWSTRNLVIAAACIVFLIFLGHALHIRVEKWRLQAVVEERQRLAHELHDTLAQSFAGIGFQLRAIRKKVPEHLLSLQDQIDVTVELVRQGHQEARQSISALRPDSTGLIELLPALTKAAKKMISGGSLNLEISTIGDPRRIPLKITDVLYRAGQEAIANSVRHAQAKQIAIELVYERKALLLSVKDDGLGFSPSRASEGFGLRGIQKRVDIIGGTVRILSTHLQGTCIEIRVPLAPTRWIFHPFAARNRSKETLHKTGGALFNEPGA